MERTEPRVVHPRSTELYRLRDDLNDVGRRFNALDTLLGNHEARLTYLLKSATRSGFHPFKKCRRERTLNRGLFLVRGDLGVLVAHKYLKNFVFPSPAGKSNFSDIAGLFSDKGLTKWGLVGDPPLGHIRLLCAVDT